MKTPHFQFERCQGIVWVCDIHSSSSYLNKDEMIDTTEEFFSRLHWLGKVAVNSAGGEFIKWTGDGFLAWFPVKLHREIGSQAANVLRTIWLLTIINNVTSLGVSPKVQFRLKHGLTIERDAILTKISDERAEYYDLIGRSVVLAFRIAGIKIDDFPGVVTQREIVELTASEDISYIKFKRLRINAEERLKYFKGDKLGTDSIYCSTNQKKQRSSIKTILRRIDRITASTTQQNEVEINSTITQFIEAMQSGPIWANQVLNEYIKFVREDLLGSLHKVKHVLETSQEKSEIPDV